MADFATFKVQEIIMHGIPFGRRDKGALDENFTGAPITMSNEERSYITLKLRGTLGDRGRPVIETASLMSTTPDLIRGFFNGVGNFVSDSQELARLLHGAQKWMSSAGLVMVVLGKIDNEDCVVVAKMEHQEGMRVQPIILTGGLKTYKAEHLRDLILAEGTKVFKAGIFAASGARTGALLSGLVADDQLGGQDVAGYFVHYLGCDFVRRPDILTKTFFDETQRFIAHETKSSPTQRADYEIALIVEMQSATSRISPSLFASKHLHRDHQEGFLLKMREIGLSNSGFPKDVTLIESSIKRMKVQTSRGATLFIPPAMHDDGSLRVVKARGENKSSRITLIDEITDIRGAGGPKSRERKRKRKDG